MLQKKKKTSPLKNYYTKSQIFHSQQQLTCETNEQKKIQNVK